MPLRKRGEGSPDRGHNIKASLPSWNREINLLERVDGKGFFRSGYLWRGRRKKELSNVRQERKKRSETVKKKLQRSPLRGSRGEKCIMRKKLQGSKRQCKEEEEGHIHLSKKKIFIERVNRKVEDFHGGEVT